MRHRISDQRFKPLQRGGRVAEADIDFTDREDGGADCKMQAVGDGVFEGFLRAAAGFGDVPAQRRHPGQDGQAVHDDSRLPQLPPELQSLGRVRLGHGHLAEVELAAGAQVQCVHQVRDVGEVTRAVNGPRVKFLCARRVLAQHGAVTRPRQRALFTEPAG
jgi:hypothetical protein